MGYYLRRPEIGIYSHLPLNAGAGMGKVHAIGKTIITVYANDHLPPHFHVVHPDFEALIEVETFAIYAGALKGSAGRAAVEWATSNVQVIKAEWNRVNPRFPVK